MMNNVTIFHLFGVIEMSVDTYSEEIQDIQQNIKRIKLMVWAGDIETARTLLYELETKHQLLFDEAKKLKTEINSFKLKNRDLVRQRIQLQKPKWKVDYLVEQELAIEVRDRILNDYKMTLFPISQLNAIVSKLHQRIARVSGDEQNYNNRPTILPVISNEFQIKPVQITQNSSTFHGYRLAESQLNLSKIRTQLDEQINGNIIIIEGLHNERLVLPMQMRIFSTEAMIDILLISNTSLSISMTHTPDFNSQSIIEIVSSAVSGL